MNLKFRKDTTILYESTYDRRNELERDNSKLPRINTTAGYYTMSEQECQKELEAAKPTRHKSRNQSNQIVTNRP